MKKEDFDFIKNLLEERAGWGLSEDKLYLLDRRLTKIVRQNNWASINDLIIALRKGSRTLKDEVVEEMAITDTCFFRDFRVFEQFRKVILNHLIKAKQSKKTLKIWSAGCSSGQEAYSIAMLLKEKNEYIKDWAVEVIGTDISNGAILQAQKGRYSQFEVQLGLPASLMIKYFNKQNEHWYINDELKTYVDFKQYNLMEDMSFASSFDMVMCRNLFKYLEKEKRVEIIKKIHSTQPIGGLLYIGKGEENTEGLLNYYKPVANVECLYQSIHFDPTKKPTKQEVEEAVETAKKAPPKIMRPDGL